MRTPPAAGRCRRRSRGTPSSTPRRVPRAGARWRPCPAAPSPGRTRRPGTRWPLLRLLRAQRLEPPDQRRVPEVVRALVPLTGREVVERGEVLDVLHPRPPSAGEDVRLLVRLHERSEVEPELLDVVAREGVPERDAHRAGLAVQPVLEAERPRTSAHVLRLGLQDRAIVTTSLQLERGTQAGEPASDDHDAQRLRGRRDGRRVAQQRGAERGPCPPTLRSVAPP